MARSIKKGPYVPHSLIKAIEKAKKDKDPRPLRTYKRGAMITPEMIGLSIDVHCGKAFSRVVPIPDMIGCKLGEFAPTRKFRGHTKKGKK